MIPVPSTAPLRYDLSGRPSIASRRWVLALSKIDSLLAAPCQPSEASTVNCQPSTVNRAAFEPDLNYSRFRDALTLRVYGLPQFLDSGPPLTAKKAFEPDLNYSRFRDAALPFYLDGWPRIARPDSQGGSPASQPPKSRCQNI